MQPEKYFAVYDADGNRLIKTPNILKARTFASVRGLSEESDKGEKKPEISLSDVGIKSPSSGKKLSPEGVKVDGYLRKAWDAMPDAHEAFSQVTQQIKAEKRKEVTIKLANLRMNPKGFIHQKGSQFAYPMEESAWRRLLPICRCFPSARTFMELMDTERRADTFNYMMNRFASSDGLQSQVKIGLREIDGKRSVYRFVSTQYASWGADEVLDGFISHIPKGGKGEVSYNPKTTMVRATVLFNSPNEPKTGDIFKLGIRLKTGDKRNSGVSAGIIAHRLKCDNRIEYTVENGDSMYEIHKGAVEPIMASFNNIVGKASSVFDRFISDWNKLDRPINQTCLWGRSFPDVPSALDWAVSNGKITSSVSNNVLVEALLSGYDFERGTSLQSLINAVTRAAHTSNFRPDVRTSLESQSGTLLKELVLAERVLA